MERVDGEAQSKVDQVLPAPGHPELLAVEEYFPAQDQQRLSLVLNQGGAFSMIKIPVEQIGPGMIYHLEWISIPGLPESVLGAWECTTHGNGDLFLFEVHPDGAKLLLQAAAVDSCMEHSAPAPGTWKAKRNIWSSTYKGDYLQLRAHAVEAGPSDLELTGIEQDFDRDEKLVASRGVSHWFTWDEAEHGYRPKRSVAPTAK